MEFTHSLKEASEFATAALAQMAERNIVAHPNNFTIWYSYFSKLNPELNQALDVLLTENEEFSEYRSAIVYQKFCSTPMDAVPMHIIADRMERELQAALATLQCASDSATSYGDTLEEAEGQLRKRPKAESLVTLLTNVLSRTRSMAQQSREVEKQLRQYISEVSQLQQELEGAREEALTDPLTGLANRRKFDFILRTEAMDGMENGNRLSLLLLDIDNFKSFNDTYGHHVGDHVLKLLATVLKESVKGQDTPARFGGDEFAVILPRTQVMDAARLAENIRQRITEKRIIHRKTGEQLGRVSVSIGATQFLFGEPLKEFIARADHALYLAKRGGRNRVVAENERKEKLMAFDI